MREVDLALHVELKIQSEEVLLRAALAPGREDHHGCTNVCLDPMRRALRTRDTRRVDVTRKNHTSDTP